MNLSRFFHEKVVLITGSSRGIGREAARQALGAGAFVVLNGRNAAALENTRAALGSTDRSMAVAADLSRPEQAEGLVAAILARWGRIDVVINNAGSSMRGGFADLRSSTVRSMIDGNFLSAVWTTWASLAALRASRGRVVFVSSLAGLRGFPGVSLYSASKMALTALQQSLRAEEGPRGVAFGLVFLAFTENDPDKTILASDGQAFRHERPWAMSQRKAARALLLAAARGRKRTILTGSGWWLAVTQAVLPGLVDLIVDSSKGRFHSLRPGS